MKEASGELSMTAITVVAIAAIAVVFTTLIWPGIKANITRSTNCSQAFNCDMKTCPQPGDLCECWYIPAAKTAGAEPDPEKIKCPNNSN